MCVCECVCVRECVCTRTHAAGGSGNPPQMFKHKPGLLLTFLWIKPYTDGDPALEDCDFLAHESCSLKMPGRWCYLLSWKGHHAPPSTGQGASPTADSGVAVGSDQLLVFRCEEMSFFPLQVPCSHSGAPLRDT